MHRVISKLVTFCECLYWQFEVFLAYRSLDENNSKKTSFVSTFFIFPGKLIHCFEKYQENKKQFKKQFEAENRPKKLRNSPASAEKLLVSYKKEKACIFISSCHGTSIGLKTGERKINKNYR